MHATPCINHAKFPYARLVSPDRNITPSLAPTSSAYRDVPPRQDWETVVVCGGERRLSSDRGADNTHPMKADAKRNPPRSYRLSPRWSVFTLATQPSSRPRFNGLTIRGGRQKSKKTSRPSPWRRVSYIFLGEGEKENKEPSCKIQRDSEGIGRDRIYRLAIFEKVEKFLKGRKLVMPQCRFDIVQEMWEISKIIFARLSSFFFFLHASIIATRAIIQFYSIFSFSLQKRNEKQISFNF